MNGEEFEFAKWLDVLPEVECWVRNIDRNPQYSFWLQTSSDKFYPDFIAKLTNGKYLVLEYKGEQLDNKDTEEKTKLGKMWASLSDDVEYATVFKTGEFDYKVVVKELIKKLGL
jgi:type III restriction enzyme